MAKKSADITSGANQLQRGLYRALMRSSFIIAASIRSRISGDNVSVIITDLFYKICATLSKKTQQINIQQITFYELNLLEIMKRSR